MLKSNVIRILIFSFVFSLVLACDLSSARGFEPPYPQSTAITNVSFDWSTHSRQAPGSDNWVITWAANDHQYTSWGDGGGFHGTNNDGRVSLGVARVEGSKDSYSGHNVWGGKSAENEATAEGKSYGLIDIDETLYMWVSPGSNVNNYREARLYTSTDDGATWEAATWAFTQEEGLILPAFLQFGKGYENARDDYVYIYANHLKDDSKLAVHNPGEIALMRVPKANLLDRSQYAFFAGTEGDNNPIWTDDLNARVPVFQDSQNGVGWTTSVSYNPTLDRYFLMTEHGQTFKSNIGIFDSPTPWGPWSTALYGRFGEGQIEPTTFFYNFSNKWLSDDGKNVVMVFTGIESNDSWNTVEGIFETAQ